MKLTYTVSAGMAVERVAMPQDVYESFYRGVRSRDADVSIVVLWLSCVIIGIPLCTPWHAFVNA